MACEVEDTKDEDCEASADYDDCYDNHPYRLCEKTWEDEHPLTETCGLCMMHHSDDWRTCIDPIFMFPPCPSEDPAEWPVECTGLVDPAGNPFTPADCCSCAETDDSC